MLTPPQKFHSLGKAASVGAVPSLQSGTKPTQAASGFLRLGCPLGFPPPGCSSPGVLDVSLRCLLGALLLVSSELSFIIYYTMGLLRNLLRLFF